MPLMDRAEEAELARRIKSGDQAALDRLVNVNLPYVATIAGEYLDYGIAMDDLIKEGNVGLVRAAARFDPAHGSRFISYAVWWIRHAMLHAIQEHRLSDLKINEQN